MKEGGEPGGTLRQEVPTHSWKYSNRQVWLWIHYVYCNTLALLHPRFCYVKGNCIERETTIIKGWKIVRKRC